jgi:hypothetical protein
MSGFFCVRKKTLAIGRANCNPIGFKIGLEVMARCRCKKVKDVPITFQERVAGESKLTMTQNVEYIKQLIALYLDQWVKMLWIIFGGAFMIGFIVISLMFIWKVTSLLRCVCASCRSCTHLPVCSARGVRLSRRVPYYVGP